MLWPVLSTIGRLLGNTVGKSVARAWQHVSAESGQNGLFIDEIRKAWNYRQRLFRRMLDGDRAAQDGPQPMMGKPGDSHLHNPDDYWWQKDMNQWLKDNPVKMDPTTGAGTFSERSSTSTTIGSGKRMPVSEAVKVMHLDEATSDHVEKRFEILMKSNNWQGGSKYIHDKIVHARAICLDALKRGTLSKHFKNKPIATHTQQEEIKMDT